VLVAICYLPMVAPPPHSHMTCAISPLISSSLLQCVVSRHNPLDLPPCSSSSSSRHRSHHRLVNRQWCVISTCCMLLVSSYAAVLTARVTRAQRPGMGIAMAGAPAAGGAPPPPPVPANRSMANAAGGYGAKQSVSSVSSYQSSQYDPRMSTVSSRFSSTTITEEDPNMMAAAAAYQQPAGGRRRSVLVMPTYRHQICISCELCMHMLSSVLNQHNDAILDLPDSVSSRETTDRSGTSVFASPYANESYGSRESLAPDAGHHGHPFGGASAPMGMPPKPSGALSPRHGHSVATASVSAAPVVPRVQTFTSGTISAIAGPQVKEY